GVGLTYQWKKGSGDLSATNDSYTITNFQTSDNGNYSVVVTGDCGEVTSNIAVLTATSTVSPTVAISGGTSICSGSDVTISVTSSTGGGTAPTYAYFYG